MTFDLAQVQRVGEGELFGLRAGCKLFGEALELEKFVVFYGSRSENILVQSCDNE